MIRATTLALALLFSNVASAAPLYEGESAPLVAAPTLVEQITQVGRDTGHVAAQIATRAMGYLGLPYRFGGNSAATGFDCSGFVHYLYENTLGLVLPRRAAEQAQATTVIAKDELRPGDLVFFNTMKRAFSHVGIYLGDGKFIHSPRKGETVRVSDMTESYWVKRFNGARRVDGVTAADAQRLLQTSTQ